MSLLHTLTPEYNQRLNLASLLKKKVVVVFLHLLRIKVWFDTNRPTWQIHRLNEEFTVKSRNRLLREKRKVHQVIKIFLYLGTSVSLKNVWSCESLSVPYSMRVWRAKSEILSMGVCMRDTVRWAARLAVYVALMIITANQKTDTVTLPDHDLGCSAPCRTYAFHDDQTELLKLRVSASLMTSGLSWSGSKWKQRYIPNYYSNKF